VGGPDAAQGRAEAGTSQLGVPLEREGEDSDHHGRDERDRVRDGAGACDLGSSCCPCVPAAARGRGARRQVAQRPSPMSAPRSASLSPSLFLTSTSFNSLASMQGATSKLANGETAGSLGHPCTLKSRSRKVSQHASLHVLRCAASPLQVAELDLAQFKSVHEFAAQWSRRPVHVLINNAGVFSMGGQSCPPSSLIQEFCHSRI